MVADCMATELVRSNSSDHAGAESSFTDCMATLSDRIDYRVVDTNELCKVVFRLRYRAYVRDGMFLPNDRETFSDRYDQTENVDIWALYIDDELASSVRLHVLSKEQADSPALQVFSDILRPELDAGKVIIDASCFVVDENIARLHPVLPYATFRLCMLAARYFSADQILAAVTTEHEAFYRRAFNYQLICEPRAYPLLAKPLGLMAVHYPSQTDQLTRRYPFLRSPLFERRMLFDRPTRSLQPEARERSVEMSPVFKLDTASAAPY
jgi:hypothetical protein